jgi:hypothetical protein
MRTPLSKPLRATSLSVLIVLAGCASRAGGADPLGYATTPCTDLDVAIGDTSKSISSVAITRGRIDRLNIPFWVPGGDKAVSALKDRQSRKIDQLEGQLEAMRSARRAQCP